MGWGGVEWIGLEGIVGLWRRDVSSVGGGVSYKTG